MDPCVNHLQISTQPNFDRRGTVHTRTQYSYFLGSHGPFVDTFAEGQDTTAAVQTAMQANIDKLRAVGADLSDY